MAQLPDAVRYGTPILVRADGAGATKGWLSHLRGLRGAGMQVEFSVGFPMTEPVQAAILALPAAAWTPAVQADGQLRDGADVAELTGVLPGRLLAGYPAGMRVLVRRERPHPGAQLTFTDVDGFRFQTFATDTRRGQLAHLEARHRAHARVEDRDDVSAESVSGFRCRPIFPQTARYVRTVYGWPLTERENGLQPPPSRP